MDRSTLLKYLAGTAVAIVLGFIAGRQQQLVDTQREILREIQELKTSPQDQQPEPSTDFKMRIEGAAIKGEPGAKLTVIEFSDFECPYCGRHTRESLPLLDRDYIQTGKIRYVFRHFPLAQIHPRAVKAGEAGECARLQGKFWPLHDRLFAFQKDLERPALINHAREVGLDLSAFETCLNGQASATVLADLNEGTALGINATPTFFFGFVQNDGTVHVVERLVGARPYAAFQTVLEGMLK